MAKKLRILAASDIHGDAAAVKKLAEKAEREKADLVVLCGDITGFVETKDIIAPFKRKNKKVLIIPGNHDSFATTDFLAQLYNIHNIHGYSARYENVGFFGAGGAENLLGRGDMLFINSELSKPKRLQGAYLTDAEIERVTDFLRDSNTAEYQEDLARELSVANEQTRDSPISNADDDILFDQAKQLVIQANRASASLLQRRLKVGYARAARLLDSLADQGIIGPQEGSKPREILVSKQDDQRFYQEGDDDLYNTGGETKAD